MQQPDLSSVQNAQGFGIYDRAVIERLKTMRPFSIFRGVVAVVGDIKHVPIQAKTCTCKSK